MWTGDFWLSDVYNQVMQILEEPNLDPQLVLNQEAAELYLADKEKFF